MNRFWEAIDDPSQKSSPSPTTTNTLHPPHWAPNLLLDCAKAVASKDVGRVQQLMWLLNELSSPYGDCDQRMASCFLQALFCRITGTGPRCCRILNSVAERSSSFDSMRRMMLKFQEVSPWTTFGHVAANGVILESLEGESRVHLVDISNTLCTQWPTFLESLATRPEGAPNLKLTSVITSREDSAGRVITEIGNRMNKFARLMGVPFEFRSIREQELHKLDASRLRVEPGEALVINCISSLGESGGSLEKTLENFRMLNPKILTLVEQELNLSSPEFIDCFGESLRFHSMFFDSLEQSFPRTSNERLMVERVLSRNVISTISCESSSSLSKRSFHHSGWSERLNQAGFKTISWSDDVRDDIRALLKRYREGWGFISQESVHALFLTWREQSTISASAWKPCFCLRVPVVARDETTWNLSLILSSASTGPEDNLVLA